MARVALVSREVAPFGGGGIGRYVHELAALLADPGGSDSSAFEVTIFTTSRHRRAAERLRRQAPESLPAARIVFVSEPRSWEANGSFSLLHAWSARVHEALVAEYGPEGPELVEFCDFLGEGCVTAQARRTASPVFARTTLAVRVHGTAEIYDVLDGFRPRELERSFTYELERYALRYCDVLLHAGGDILGAYERFYGDELGPAELVRHPLSAPPPAARAPQAPHAGGPPPAEGPLRLLYLGRLERRKGVRALVEAMLGIAGLDGSEADWRLTMVGSDTDTAPLGGSMRELLELEVAGDPRVRMLDAVSPAEVPALLESHDALAVPSRWECWPYVALEALRAGTPLIATPTGGLTEIVDPDTEPGADTGGAGGWLAAGTSAAELAAAIAPLAADPAPVRDPARAASARERAAQLADPEGIAAAYADLCARGAARRSPRSSAPLVSIVIPYFEMERHLAETVASAAAQTHPRTELVIVNDGSFRRVDEILLELESRYRGSGLRIVSQPNSGLGSARNLGVEVSHGEYVLALDADNVLEPEFAARCVAALEADPQIAFASSWFRYVDDSGAPWKGTEELMRPLGNSLRAVDELNVAADAVAVLRRSVFEAGLRYSTDIAGFEDWALYREMRERGMVGHVIPEPLFRYRLRDDSMMRVLSSPREQWVRQAIDAHLAEARVDWTGTAAP